MLSGGGGVGKSQLAASYARDALAGGTDLVVWVDAAQPGAIIEAYARAAVAIQDPAVEDADVEALARDFLSWAATTSQSWLVILDHLTNPAEVTGLWPTSLVGAGWVLATTRRRDAILSGSGRILIDVGMYALSQANAYLERRLTEAGLPWLVDDHAEVLDLPYGAAVDEAHRLTRLVGVRFVQPEDTVSNTTMTGWA